MTIYRKYKISRYANSLGIRSADSDIYDVPPYYELCIINACPVTTISNEFTTVICKLGLQS